MNRRHFFRQTSVLLASTAASPLFAELAKDNEYRQNIGLQLYTMRKELEANTADTLKAIAAAGYKQVEMFGFPSKTEAMIKGSKDNGLALNSTHFDWDSLINPEKEGNLDAFKVTIEKAHAIGLTNLVIPFLQPKNRTTLDDFKKVAEKANAGAALTKAAGIQLSYHNHSFEFKPLDGGKTGFDVFVAEFSKDMQFELDLFWVKVGGHEPLDLMKKLAGRISQLHLKDLKADVKTPEYGSVPPEAFQELGDGIISWEPILAAAKAAGVKHCHVEQDQSPDATSSVQQSIRYLAKI